MKVLAKSDMHTRLARGGLSKQLQNSITYILGVENDKVEQPPSNDDTRRRCKTCAKCVLLHLMEKGINQLKIQWAK